MPKFLRQEFIILMNLRRWSRRLILFYEIMNNLTSEYTRDPIPPLHQSQYCFRNQDVIGRIRARTEKFESSFYPKCLSEWNQFDPEIRLAKSLSIFKTKLLSIIRPPAKSVFGIHDPSGLSYLTRLRVGLSKLNFHKFKQSFRDTINPIVLRTMVLRMLSTFCHFSFSFFILNYLCTKSLQLISLILQKESFINQMIYKVKNSEG